MKATPFEFLVLAVAVWRATHMVVYDLGPFDAFERLRALAGAREVGGKIVVRGTLGKLVTCPWCVSIWMAAPAALLAEGWSWWAIPVWLALAGVAAVFSELLRKL